MTVVVSHLNNPEGRQALSTAVAEARSRATRLLVVAPSTAAAEGPDSLAELGARLDQFGVEHDVVTSEGDLAEALVTAAARARAELIVIGLRRRSPVGKLILGSGAQRILLDAPCPVLAVKS
ncbi:universal stress protein [Xylanimonas ulmi]|uniref:Universal stress protein family protein n=1 Tax=Xylanimonas ulmi TaxID=228973 RepID=A0A4Q7M1Q5_9MICO|nr:universal stress protein [Xylanibacterium ulmi]RZS60512.1 universal stress protein family protein [Xylanibacterium ulmi]